MATSATLTSPCAFPSDNQCITCKFMISDLIDIVPAADLEYNPEKHQTIFISRTFTGRKPKHGIFLANELKTQMQTDLSAKHGGQVRVTPLMVQDAAQEDVITIHLMIDFPEAAMDEDSTREAFCGIGEGDWKVMFTGNDPLSQRLGFFKALQRRDLTTQEFTLEQL
ncbi:hypothetical protein BJY04DRAFT_214756 [Aspergillus karnatakaensis]|uniref:uncharacterized protein n=1 Tax=Aspergillus karnatakaensis TaxID=1810916 RepID=UPI003CCD0909